MVFRIQLGGKSPEHRPDANRSGARDLAARLPHSSRPRPDRRAHPGVARGHPLRGLLPGLAPLRRAPSHLAASAVPAACIPWRALPFPLSCSPSWIRVGVPLPRLREPDRPGPTGDDSTATPRPELTRVPRADRPGLGGSRGRPAVRGCDGNRTRLARPRAGQASAGERRGRAGSREAAHGFGLGRWAPLLPAVLPSQPCGGRDEVQAHLG